MKRISLLVIAILMCAAGSLAQVAAPAQKPAAQAPPTISSVINRQISGVERDFVPLAEAMPEDKFDFAPTNGEFKGVRTFGQMVKHVAVTNQLLAAAMLGEKPPVTGDEAENGPAAIKTKAQIVQYLKDSFAN